MTNENQIKYRFKEMWMGGTHFALQISNDGGITWVFANAYTCQIVEDKLNGTEIKI